MSRRTYKRVVAGLYFTICAFALTAGIAQANPEDGQVVAGSATIQTSPKKLDVYQSTQKAVINWNRFNIAPDEHTQFHQPNSSSFTLNRVKDTNPSRIEGMLSANGNIAIINPNGIYFDQGAKIDVGGIIASTADITDEDFMAGRGNFTVSGKPDARIINNGNITVKDAGLVGLVAPQVVNNGVIKAKLGKVNIASGDTFVYDFNGDELISVAVEEENASLQKIVKNNGTIQADGGAVLMTAGAAREVVDSLVTNTGVIEAKSVGRKNGKIVLSGSGSNGTQKTGTATVLNEGVLDVSGHGSEEETGGMIHLLGDHVGAMTGSQTVASGNAGGGEILIGGDYQGADSTQKAQRTYVDQSASVDASAMQNGGGGKIISWADEVNRSHGTFKAQGGTDSGDGGFIEISAKHNLDFQGAVFADSPNGEAGTILFDPTDLEISTAVNQNVTAATPFAPNLDDGPSILNTTTLLNAIASGNVTVQTSATGSQAGNITINDPLSWSANRTVNFTAHNKIVVNAPITARGTLNMTAADIDFNANMSEHASGGVLNLLPRANNITVGLAGGAGAFNLGLADLAFIQNGWNGLLIGASGGTALMDVGAKTWNVPTTLRTSTGELRINGAQTMGANNLALQTRNLTINGNLIGTGTLTITPGTNATVGIAGGAGALNISTAELDHIINGWGNIVIGHTSNTQAMNVNAYTWRDNLTLRSTTGAININATPNMGANNLTLQGRNFVLNADLVGTGTLTLQPDGNVTVGVAGGAGTLNLSTALLDRIVDGWSQINIGLTSSTQAMNVNAYTWDDSVAFRTAAGVISINGAQNVGANNLSVFSNGNPAINAPLIGSGNLRFEQVATNITMGLAGETGTYNLTAAELDQIADGWNLISFGLVTNDAVFRIGAYDWNDSVKFQNDSGVITIAGAQNVGANNLTIHSDANPVISAPLIGTGTLTLETDATATTVGVAGGAGSYNLSAAELNQIADGWSEIVIGRTNGTGAMNVNAYNWNDSLRLQTSTGLLTIAGAQNLGTNDMRIITSSNLALNNTITGGGDLTIETSATNTTIGLAGGAGTLNLTAAELNRITDGWNSIHIGKATGTGAMTVNAYNWNDDLTFQTNTGAITIAGSQDMGANDLTLDTASLALNANLAGSGRLTITPAATTTTVGLAGGAGALNLSAAELNRIVDGWTDITIGRTDSNAAMAVNAYTWSDNLTLQTGTGAMTFAGVQNFGANDLTLNTSSLAVNANMNGTGNLIIRPADSADSIGLSGGGGTLNLTTAEIGSFNTGWANVTLGQTGGTGITTLGGDITLANSNIVFETPLELSADSVIDTATGDLTFNETVDGSFNLTANTTGDINLVGPAGLTARLGDVTFNTIHDLDSAAAFNVTSVTINGSTGNTDFNGAGLDSAGDVDIESENITGTLLGVNGTLNSGTGTITATTSFASLDIDGAGATLSGGYIGAPGPATQSMANLITKGGLFVSPPSALFTFEGFEIGYVEPSSSMLDNLGETTLQDIVNVLRQPSGIDIRYTRDFDGLAGTQNFYSGPYVIPFSNSEILVHPELLRDDALPHTPNENQETEPFI